MTGKEKCNLLKQIRKEIAESNGIVYLTSECTHEGDCPGFCPKCDAEIRYLDGELNKKAEHGEKVTISGISLDTFSRYIDAQRDESTDDSDSREILCGEAEPMGMPVPEIIDGMLLPGKDDGNDGDVW